MASPHQVLGVEPDADRETVERRYRELVKEVHPDAGGSAEEFKRVRRAYRAIVNDDGAGTAAGSSGAGASGPTGPGSSRGNRRTGPGSSRSGAGTGRTDSGGTRSGTAGNRSGTANGRGGQSTGRTGSDRSRRSGATGASDRGAGGRYTAAGREHRTSSAAGAGAAGTGTAGSAGGGAGTTGSRGGTPSGRKTGEQGHSSGVPRRWFLYGFSALFAGGAYAFRDQTLSDLLSDDSGGGEPERSAASGLPVQDSASREVGPQDLFDVGFETPDESTVHFTVDGADSRDWINVYTREEYERVASNWDGEGEFDPGNPLETVLTNDGYVADLPEAGTYVILIKLWAGPPNDPRQPRTVEVSYEVTA